MEERIRAEILAEMKGKQTVAEVDPWAGVSADHKKILLASADDIKKLDEKGMAERADYFRRFNVGAMPWPGKRMQVMNTPDEVFHCRIVLDMSNENDPKFFNPVTLDRVFRSEIEKWPTYNKLKGL